MTASRLTSSRTPRTSESKDLNSYFVPEFPALRISTEIETTARVAALSAVGESDEQLLASLCNEDKEALGILFRRYARIVRGIALKVLRDRSEADDLVQDVFLLIHRDCHKFDPSKGSARFWVVQMAYHRALSRRRALTSRHFYTYIDLDDAVDWLPDSMATRCQHSIEASLGKSTARKMFDALSRDQRETLRLHFIEGYTIEEVAAKLGQSKGNIRHHCCRGLERLRKQLFPNDPIGVTTEKPRLDPSASNAEAVTPECNAEPL